MVGIWRTWWDDFKGEAYGRRQPLVLINGLAEQAESWFRNVPFWRRYFDVYLPNLLVYDGAALHQRIEAGDPISIDYLVEQLREYLQSFVQTPPYHLVGSSLGGKVVVEFAARYPELVNRIVLICPSGMGDEERLPVIEGVCRNNVRALVDSVFYDPSQADRRMLHYYGKQFVSRRWKTGLLRTVRGTMNHCVRDRMADVLNPALLVSGREDRIVERETCRRSRQAAAGRTLRLDPQVRPCAATGEALANQPPGAPLPHQQAPIRKTSNLTVPARPAEHDSLNKTHDEPGASYSVSPTRQRGSHCKTLAGASG